MKTEAANFPFHGIEKLPAGRADSQSTPDAPLRGLASSARESRERKEESTVKIKLCVIGGGSVNWMRGLMKDVYTLDGVAGGEIRLVDPNNDHVTSVKNMLLKFNELTDKEFDVSVVEER